MPPLDRATAATTIQTAYRRHRARTLKGKVRGIEVFQGVSFQPRYPRFYTLTQEEFLKASKSFQYLVRRPHLARTSLQSNGRIILGGMPIKRDVANAVRIHDALEAGRFDEPLIVGVATDIRHDLVLLVKGFDHKGKHYQISFDTFYSLHILQQAKYSLNRGSGDIQIYPALKRDGTVSGKAMREYLDNFSLTKASKAVLAERIKALDKHDQVFFHVPFSRELTVTVIEQLLKIVCSAAKRGKLQKASDLLDSYEDIFRGYDNQAIPYQTFLKRLTIYLSIKNTKNLQSVVEAIKNFLRIRHVKLKDSGLLSLLVTQFTTILPYCRADGRLALVFPSHSVLQIIATDVLQGTFKAELVYGALSPDDIEEGMRASTRRGNLILDGIVNPKGAHGIKRWDDATKTLHDWLYHFMVCSCYKASTVQFSLQVVTRSRELTQYRGFTYATWHATDMDFTDVLNQGDVSLQASASHILHKLFGASPFTTEEGLGFICHWLVNRDFLLERGSIKLHAGTLDKMEGWAGKAKTLPWLVQCALIESRIIKYHAVTQDTNKTVALMYCEYHYPKSFKRLRAIILDADAGSFSWKKRNKKDYPQDNARAVLMFTHRGKNAALSDKVKLLSFVREKGVEQKKKKAKM